MEDIENAVPSRFDQRNRPALRAAALVVCACALAALCLGTFTAHNASKTESISTDFRSHLESLLFRNQGKRDELGSYGTRSETSLISSLIGVVDRDIQHRSTMAAPLARAFGTKVRHEQLVDVGVKEKSLFATRPTTNVGQATSQRQRLLPARYEYLLPHFTRGCSASVHP